MNNSYRFKIEVQVNAETVVLTASVPSTQVEINPLTKKPDRIKERYREALVRKMLHMRGYRNVSFLILSATPL